MDWSASHRDFSYEFISSSHNETETIQILNDIESASHRDFNYEFISSSHNETETIQILNDIESAYNALRTSYFPFISKDHKIAYCPIAKNSCTKLKILFFSLNMNYHSHSTSFSRFRSDMVGSVHLFSSKYQQRLQYMPQNKRQLQNIMNDTHWSKIVIIRDPLERLLSGYLDKCRSGGAHQKSKEKYKECGAHNSSFQDFVETIAKRINEHDYFTINDHFRPQICHCMLWKYHDKYDYKILYTQKDIGENILSMLNDLNLTEYYYHYGKYENESLFETLTGHHTDAATKLKQYYTKDIAQKVYDAFWIDYHIFNLSKPTWIDSL